MPLFEFACRSCAARFERLVFGAERPECPACGGRDLEKLLSAFAVGGASTGGDPSPVAGGGCGRCGDPRGPGSCASD